MPTAVNTFTVSGRGPFPLDMLRYDSAWPVNTVDAETIARSFDPVVTNSISDADMADLTHGKRWSIKLHTADRHAPTRARWDSFNVRVGEPE